MTDTAANPKRATIAFTVDEIEEFLEGEVGYKVVFNEQTGSGRWRSVHRLVVERLEDGTFWAATYQLGLTEMQHLDRYERWGIDTYDRAERDTEKITFTQVFANTVSVTVYS